MHSRIGAALTKESMATKENHHPLQDAEKKEWKKTK